MATSSNIFVDLILGQNSPSYTVYVAAVESVMKDPSQIRLLMIQEQFRNQLLLDFDRAAPRLVRFFDTLAISRKIEHLSTETMLNLIVPIIYASHQLVNLEPVVQILISALAVIRSFSSTQLQKLALALAETDGLLERLVSDRQGNQLMSDWLETSTSRTLGESLVLERFMQRLVMLCNSCSLGHNITDVLTKWQQLRNIKVFLEAFKADPQPDSIVESSKAGDPASFNFTPLQKDDKKSNKAQKQRVTVFMPDIPADTLESLTSFGFSRPTSDRMLRVILDSLSLDETFLLLQSVIKSFPCRVCNENARGVHQLAQFSASRPDDNQVPDTAFDSELFGKRVGLWKVLLSAQALKDARNLSHSGITHLCLGPTSTNPCLYLSSRIQIC